MMRRLLIISVALLSSSCSDQRHPPLGGAILTNAPIPGITPVDASTNATPGNGAITTVSGRLCIVSSILSPDSCPTTDSNGEPIDFSAFSIAERGTANRTTPQTNGAFSLIVSAKDQAEMVVSSSSTAANNRPSLIVSDVGNMNQNAPILDPSARTELFQTIDDVLEQTDTATVVIYTGVAGATVESLSTGASVLYERNGRWETTPPTGQSGVVLILGIPVVTDNDTIQIDQPKSRFTVPIDRNTTTFSVAP